jgi:hypothetical protein
MRLRRLRCLAVLPGWRLLPSLPGARTVRAWGEREGLDRRAAEKTQTLPETQTPPLAIGMVNEGATALSEEPNQGHV